MAPSRRKRAKTSAPSRKWNVGELVLAKVKGYQAWPAIVSEPEKWGYPADLKKVLVYFFGTKEIALCNPADLEEFTEAKKLTLLGKRQGKSSAFFRALDEIIDSFNKSKKQGQVSGAKLFGENDTAADNISGYSSTKFVKDEAGPISVEQLSAGVTDCPESITESVVAAPLTDALHEEEMQLEEAHDDLSSTERHVYPTSSKADTSKSGNCTRKRTYSGSLRSSSRVDTHSSDECSTADLGCVSAEGESFDEYNEEQTGLSGRVDLKTNSRAIQKKRKANQQTNDTSLVEVRADLVVSEHEMPETDGEILNEITTLNRCSQPDGDEHLPLAKRARIRMGSPAGCEVGVSVCEDEIFLEVNDSTNILSDGALSFKSANMECIKRDLSSTSPIKDEVETLVHEQEEPEVDEDFGMSGPLNCYVDAPVDETSNMKLGPDDTSISLIPVRNLQSVVSMNGFTDGESSLPLSKRIHRALEAMSANVAAAGDIALSCSPCVNVHGDGCLSTRSVECSEMPVKNKAIIKLGLGPMDNDRVGDSQESAYEHHDGMNIEVFENHGKNFAADCSKPEIYELSRENMENVKDKCVVMSTLSKRPAESDEVHLKTKSPKSPDLLGSSTICLISPDNSFKIGRSHEATPGSDPNVSPKNSDLSLAEETAADSLNAVKCTLIDVFDSAVDEESHEGQHLKPEPPKKLEHLGCSPTCLISANDDFKIVHMEEAALGSDHNVSRTNSDSVLAEEAAADSLNAVKCSSIDILDSAVDEESHEDQHLKPKSPKALDHIGNSTTCLISAENGFEVGHTQEAATGSDPNVSFTNFDSILAEETAAGPVNVEKYTFDTLRSAVDEECDEKQHLKPESPIKLDHLGSNTTCLISADNSFKIGHVQEAAAGSDPNVSCTNSDSILAEETVADSLSAEKCTSIDILDSAVDDKNQMKQLLLFENNLDSQRSEFVKEAAKPASPDSSGVPPEGTTTLSATKNCLHPPPSSIADNNLADGQDPIALVSPPSSSLSSSKVESLSSFEDIVRSLTRSKETIGRATRIAIDCAKLGFASKVVEILALSLERESRLPKKVDLFFLVDSIAQCSRCLKGDCGIYPTIIQPLLPRLLAAAAPPDLNSYENQRQCVKVLRVWLEKKILPESIIRHHIEKLHAFIDLYRSGGSRRSFRNERAFDDPFREIEGMLVDEYGSNSNIQFPGFRMPPMLNDSDEESDSDGDDFETVTPEHNVESRDGGKATAEVRKRNHILEGVDGELEIEDVAPCSDFKITTTSDNDGTSRVQRSFHLSDNQCGLPFTYQQFEVAPPPPPPPAYQAQPSGFSHAVHKYENYKRNPRECRWEQSDLPRSSTRAYDKFHRYTHEDRAFGKEPKHFADSRQDCSFSDKSAVHFPDRASNDIHPVDDDFHRGAYLPHSHPSPSRQFSYAPERRSRLRRDMPPHQNRYRPRYAGNSSSSRDFERDRYAPPQSGTREYWGPPSSASTSGQCHDNQSRIDQVPYPPSYPNNRSTSSGNRRRISPWLVNHMQDNQGGPVPVGNRGPNNWKSR